MARYKPGINSMWETEWLLINNYTATNHEETLVTLLNDYFWDPQFAHKDNTWVLERTSEVLEQNQQIPISNFAQWHFTLYIPEKPLTITLYEPRQWIEMVSAPKGRTYLNTEKYTLENTDALLIPSWIYHSVENSYKHQTLLSINARLRIGHYDWTGIVPR